MHRDYEKSTDIILNLHISSPNQVSYFIRILLIVCIVYNGLSKMQFSVNGCEPNFKELLKVTLFVPFWLYYFPIWDVP